MKKFLICSLLCIVSLITQSQPQWIQFTSDKPSKPIVNVLISTNTSIRYQVEIPGMYKESITINNQSYDRLSIPGGQKWGAPGYPELPSIGKMISIPGSSSLTVTVSLTDSITLGGYSICPSPSIIEDTSGGGVVLREVFAQNDSIYSLNTEFPGTLYNAEDGGYLRNQKILNLSGFPFKYNPVTGQLVIFMRFEVAIQIQNPLSDVNVNNGLLSRLSQSTLLNYSNIDQIQPPPPFPVPSPGTVTWMTLTDPSQADNIVADYLIITDEQFFNPQHSYSLQRLANHRASFNGFDVVIVSVQNILSLNFAYDPPSVVEWIAERKIRTFIKQVFDGQHAAHSYDGHVAFVCLIGDASIDGVDTGVPTSWDPYPTCMPGNTGVFWSANDYYYSCVTKNSNNQWDLLGDLFIGRLPADNESDLSHMVTKTISNENEYCFDDWKKINTLAYGGPFTGADSTLSYKYFCEDLPQWLNSIYNPVYSTTLIDINVSHSSWNYDYVNHLNSVGSNIVFHLGHGLFDSWCLGSNCYETGALTISYKNANLSNSGKYPFVISQACYTGTFTGVNNNDCIGEAIIQHSGNAGYVGYLGAWKAVSMGYTQPGEFPHSLQEKIMSAIYTDLSSILGEAVLEARIGVNYYHPSNFVYNLFGDPAYNLMAPGYEITHNTTLPAPPPQPQTTTISTKVFVRTGVTLSLSNGAVLEFSDDGQLIVENGAILEIGDNVTIKGQSLKNKIVIAGTLCGQGGNINNPVPVNHLTLSSLNGGYWTGIECSNRDLIVKFGNSSLANCGISGELTRLELTTASSLTGSSIHLNQSGLLVDGCTFSSSDIYLTNYQGLGVFAQVLNSTFVNSLTNSVIRIEHYPSYSILNNSITYANGTGIDLSYCGNSNGQYAIESNIIQKTGSPQDVSWGIKVYNSFSDIKNNYITNNRYGVAALNQSQVRLIGNAGASSNSGTQRIINNYQNQVRASDNSFPFYFHYNVIKNVPVGSTYLVYYDPGVPAPPPIDLTFNVKCNCFDNSNPTPQLYPSGWYQWSIWCPPAVCQFSMDAAEEFEVASANMDSANYSIAETQFKSIIESYPGTSFANESAKKMIPLTKLSDNDFPNLKLYFDTTTALHIDSITDHLTYRLKNNCDIEMGNYPQAIAWFENDILNPASLNDSVYSLIDLGNTYLMMQADSNLKSSSSNFVGALVQYKPKSWTEHELRTADWIKLLFKEEKMNDSKDDNTPASGSQYKLEQNSPNPFRNTTQLNYELPDDGHIKFYITNMIGQQVLNGDLGSKKAGKHSFTINLSGYPNGIYVIVLLSDDREVSKIKGIKQN